MTTPGFAGPGLLARAVAAFDGRPAPRRRRPADRRRRRRHRTPSCPADRRPRCRNAVGPATAFLGGAAVIRRAAFEQAGGYAGDFHYAMEETDLALRLIDDGWTIRYDGTPAVIHPRTDPSRHPDAADTHDAQPRVARLPQPAGAARRRATSPTGWSSRRCADPRSSVELLGAVRRRLAHPSARSTGPDRLAHRGPSSPGSAGHRSSETR